MGLWCDRGWCGVDTQPTSTRPRPRKSSVRCDRNLRACQGELTRVFFRFWGDAEHSNETCLAFQATAPKLDEASFAAMVERQKDVLRREAEERQRAHRPPSNPTAGAPPQDPSAPPALRSQSP